MWFRRSYRQHLRPAPPCLAENVCGNGEWLLTLLMRRRSLTRQGHRPNWQLRLHASAQHGSARHGSASADASRSGRWQPLPLQSAVHQDLPQPTQSPAPNQWQASNPNHLISLRQCGVLVAGVLSHTRGVSEVYAASDRFGKAHRVPFQVPGRLGSICFALIVSAWFAYCHVLQPAAAFTVGLTWSTVRVLPRLPVVKLAAPRPGWLTGVIVHVAD